jgi:hypothetical protein
MPTRRRNSSPSSAPRSSARLSASTASPAPTTPRTSPTGAACCAPSPPCCGPSPPRPRPPPTGSPPTAPPPPTPPPSKPPPDPAVNVTVTHPDYRQTISRALAVAVVAAALRDGHTVTVHRTNPDPLGAHRHPAGPSPPPRSIPTCSPSTPSPRHGSSASRQPPPPCCDRRKESTVKLATADLVPTDHDLLADHESWVQLVAACRVHGHRHRAGPPGRSGTRPPAAPTRAASPGGGAASTGGAAAAITALAFEPLIAATAALAGSSSR